jgi:hypothetical protein
MWHLVLAITLSGSIGGTSSSTSSHSLDSRSNNGDCLTESGVTHCWKRLGAWDPRAIPGEWNLWWRHDGKAIEPKEWGEYATEKRTE